MKDCKKRFLTLEIRKFLSVLLIFGALLIIASGCTEPDPDLNPSNDNDAPHELVLKMNRESGMKILQFADLHFGIEGTTYHNADIERTLCFIDYAIKSEKPDFIVLLGDNMVSQGPDGAKFIVDTFDKYEIPYAFVFGNHDAEQSSGTHSKQAVSDYLENCGSPYLLYKAGYTQTDIENRYGNYSISVRDIDTNDLLGAFIIVDTGIYDYVQNRYQSITEGQIDWYKDEITSLDNVYSGQKNNVHATVPTITYGHIQLPEFSEAYQKAVNGEGAGFVYNEHLSKGYLSGILNASGKVNYGFYDAMKELKSAKAYFCGHMHGLKLHVKMDGIILGFCPQAGVTSIGAKKRTTFSYVISEDFDIQLNLVTEP